MQKNELPSDAGDTRGHGMNGLMAQLLATHKGRIWILDIGQSYRELCESDNMCFDCSTPIANGVRECPKCGAGREGAKSLTVLAVGRIPLTELRRRRMTYFSASQGKADKEA